MDGEFEGIVGIGYVSCEATSSSDETGLGGRGSQASKVGASKTVSQSKSSTCSGEDVLDEGESCGEGDSS